MLVLTTTMPLLIRRGGSTGCCCTRLACSAPTTAEPVSTPARLLVRSKATSSAAPRRRPSKASVASQPPSPQPSASPVAAPRGNAAVTAATPVIASVGATALPPTARPIVVYRAPPGMKRWLYYFVGCVFTGASAYQGYILSQHMSWPLMSRDYENNPPKLVSAWTRYPAGALILGAGGLLGFFMFWSPSRLATRITLYPAISQVGVRTCAPPFRTVLPGFLRAKMGNAAPLSPHDPRERLHDFAALLRRDNTSSTQIAAFVEGKGRRVVRADHKGFKRVSSSLLLGEGNSWGYQLEAAPHPKSQHYNETKNLYKKGWNEFKLWMKGRTDWSVPHGVPGLTKVEEEAKKALHPKEPWFLDRANFDRLFPVRNRF